MKKEISILLLDETPAFEEKIRQALQRAGLTICTKRVATSEAFTRELECRSPDAILSETRLPSLAPPVAFAIAKQKRPDVPFLFVDLPDGGQAVEDHADAVQVPISKLAPTLRKELRKAEERMRLRHLELMVLTERWRTVQPASQRAAIKNATPFQHTD